MDDKIPENPVLEASWGLLGTLSSKLVFLSVFGPFWVTKMGANRKPNRSQNGPKSIITFNVEKVPLEDLLGTVLWRSWCVFGAISGSKNIGKHMVFLCFLKISFLTKIAFQEASWSQLGANLGAQEGPNGTQMGP